MAATGPDFSQFVAADVETELYVQDSGPRLLSLECTTEVKYKSRGRRIPERKTQIVAAAVPITFLLAVRVRGGDGTLWRLEVRLSYHPRGMDLPDPFALRFDFTISASAIE